MSKITTESPIGNLMYVMVTGQGKENYEGDGYEFQVCVDVPEGEAQAYVDEIEDHIEDNAPTNAKRALNKQGEEIKPYAYADEDDTIEAGMVRFTFKTKTEFEDKKTGEMKQTKVGILDSDGNNVKLPEGKFVGNGSTGRGIGTLVSWNRGNRKQTEYGGSLYLNKVQIKDFIPYEGETVEAIEGGSFKGFDNDLQPEDDDGAAEDKPARSRRRSRRGR